MVIATIDLSTGWSLAMPKPKLTNAECLALATAAHRLPEGTIGRQYQIVLRAAAAAWFQGLSSKERGAIVEAWFIAMPSVTSTNQD
jgi:hypothetical protein